MEVGFRSLASFCRWQWFICDHRHSRAKRRCRVQNSVSNKAQCLWENLAVFRALLNQWVVLSQSQHAAVCGTWSPKDPSVPHEGYTGSVFKHPFLSDSNSTSWSWFSQEPQSSPQMGFLRHSSSATRDSSFFFSNISPLFHQHLEVT